MLLESHNEELPDDRLNDVIKLPDNLSARLSQIQVAITRNDHLCYDSKPLGLFKANLSCCSFGLSILESLAT